MAALYSVDKTTVIVHPVFSMHSTYLSQAKRYDISCETWTQSSQANASPGVIIASLNQDSRQDLTVYLGRLASLGRFARLVVEEAHLLCINDAAASFLLSLRQLAPSIVLITAACPPSLERHLFRTFDQKSWQVFRRRVDRPNITHRIVRLALRPEEDGTEGTLAGEVLSSLNGMADCDRALIVCQTLVECTRIANRLGWTVCHSSASYEHRLQIIEAWKLGEVKGLACDSIASSWLDYPRIRYIFYLGDPQDAVHYCQSIGHLAMDGEPGFSVIFHDDIKLNQRNDPCDVFGAVVIRDMLYDSTLCRRLRLAIFLDGTGVSCVMLRDAQLCDVCETQLSQPLPMHCPIPFPTNLIEAYHADSGPAAEPCQELPIDTQSAPTASLKTAHPACKQNSAIFAHAVTPARKPAHAFSRQPAFIQDARFSIAKACQALATSCVRCWYYGEDQSHFLNQCIDWTQEASRWELWFKQLPRSPAGCCFFCGFPMEVRQSCTMGITILTYAPVNVCLKLRAANSSS